MNWNIDRVRALFPALALSDEGRPRLYLDAPAGTQVALAAITRVNQAMIEACANDGGAFRTSVASQALVAEAHAAGAALLGAASPEEIVFGLNTTSLLFHFSRMLARNWREGDEILLTRMDHDGNVAPWLAAAEERGVTVKWLDFDPETFRYRYETLAELIGPRTRLVACNHASNLLGTINDVARIVAAAKEAGAVTVVDGVQAAPHLAIDVRAIGCDLYATSPYKYFGPHAGMLYVRAEALAALTPLKVRPAPAVMPWRFAPGTPSFEAQSGTTGAIEHIAALGTDYGGAAGDAPLRQRILAGWAVSLAYEAGLMRRMLDGLQTIGGIRIFGVTGDLAERVPTFSFTVPGRSAAEVVQHLAARNIFAWAGSFYAHEAALRLGLQPHGVVRVGLAHYNSQAEVDRLLAEIAALA